jgi:hypothetical protein
LQSPLENTMEQSVPRPYVAGPVERIGRRLKMEYIGMASVHAVVYFILFGQLRSWTQSLAAMLGILGLFLGIKKKTRDHLSASLLLFAAAAVAAGPLAAADWAVPYLLFGATVCAMEGYVEKLQEQIYALPVLFLIWAWLGADWLPALFLFVAFYLAHPWVERPGLRRRFGMVFVATVVAAGAGTLLRLRGPGATDAGLLELHRLPLARTDLLFLLAVGLPTVVCLILYWRRLIAPHRLNGAVFTLLAPWDVRLLALYSMVAAVVLSATIFRRSIDSDRLRPIFKHLEWHFFLWVLALAVWAAFRT